MEIRLMVFLNACLLANLTPISTENAHPPKTISSLSLELMEQQNGKKFYSIVVISDNLPHENVASNTLKEETTCIFRYNKHRRIFVRKLSL